MANSKKWLAMTDEERRAKRKEYRAKYLARNPDANRESTRKYREKNRDELNEKSLAYRHANLIEVRNKKNKARRALKARAVEHMGGKCEDCLNVFHPVAFDFHHEGEKDFAISGSRLSWDEVKAELAKCVLLCATCHRIRHIPDDYQV